MSSKLTISKNSIENTGKIDIIGSVGWDFWEGGMNYREFKNRLQELAGVDLLTVEINSNGGIIPDGVAIANALADFPSTVHVYLNGIAASIASVIAMAADKLYFPSNSIMAVHKPWSGADGNADDFRKKAENLDIWESCIHNIYMAKATTKLTLNKLKQFLKEEKRFTADEAKEYFSNVHVLDGLGQPLMNSVDPVAIYDSASYFARNKPKEINMSGLKETATPSKAEFDALSEKVSNQDGKLDKILNLMTQEEKPAKGKETPVEKAEMPDLDTHDPEAINKYLDSLKQKKALEAVNWGDPASVQKYYDSLIGNKSDKGENNKAPASNQATCPVGGTPPEGKSEYAQCRTQFSKVL